MQLATASIYFSSKFQARCSWHATFNFSYRARSGFRTGGKAMTMVESLQQSLLPGKSSLCAGTIGFSLGFCFKICWNILLSPCLHMFTLREGWWEDLHNFYRAWPSKEFKNVNLPFHSMLFQAKLSLFTSLPFCLSCPYASCVSAAFPVEAQRCDWEIGCTACGSKWRIVRAQTGTNRRII